MFNLNPNLNPNANPNANSLNSKPFTLHSSLSASTGFVLTMFHEGIRMPMETVVSMMR